MMTIGCIGLGKMGVPIAERLIQAGHRVVAFNRSRGSVARLAGLGATAAGSVEELAGEVEFLLTALPTPESVAEVYRRIAANARPGLLCIEHSTVSPDMSRECAADLAARGASYVDAPVSGGPAGAEGGTLTVMVGGEEGAFERARPVLEAYGKNIRLCGPVGAGQAVKLVNQLLVAIHTAAIAEAAVLGERLGADPGVVLDLIGTSFGASAMLSRNLPRFISRDFAPATPIDLIAKDLGLIHAEARGAGVPIPLGAQVEQRFLEAAARGLGRLDMAALVQLFEAAAGQGRE